MFDGLLKYKGCGVYGMVTMWPLYTEMYYDYHQIW